MDRSSVRLALWLGLTLFAIYLLSYGGHIYSSDGWSMFAVTESVAKRGDLSTDQMWTLFRNKGETGPTGEAFAKYGYGTSLLALPFYVAARAMPSGSLGLVQATGLASAVAVALTGALLLLAALRLGYSPGVSTLAALLLGLATPAWVYAKEFWSEPFSMVTLLATFVFLLRYLDTRNDRDALAAGAALGLAIAIRLSNAALIPVFSLYAFWEDVRERRLGRGAALFGAIVAAFTLSVLIYNAVRFGNPLTSGYRAGEGFTNPLLLGLYGLLFSPGKGLFIYIPFLAVLPWALLVQAQRARRELFLWFAVVLVYAVTFATWYYWWGGTDWGPRFLVPVLPFLVMTIVPALELASFPSSRPPLPQLLQDMIDHGRLILDENFDRMRRFAHRTFALLFGFLCLLSLGIELVGVSLPALVYRLHMLGVSPNPEGDAIFIPADSPILGYLPLLKPERMDLAWLRVTESGPVVDWLSLLLLLGFVAFCAAGLWLTLGYPFPGLRRGQRVPRSGGDRNGRIQAPPGIFPAGAPTKATVKETLVLEHPAETTETVESLAERRKRRRQRRSEKRRLYLALASAAALSVIVLWRSHGDLRFGGNPGYAQLLATVGLQAQAGDVLVLNDDAVAPFFMNENRAALKWYGLARDPARADETTRALLARLTREYRRVWYAWDDSTAALANPVQEILTGAGREAVRYEYENGVHLVLLATGEAP